MVRACAQIRRFQRQGSEGHGKMGGYFCLEFTLSFCFPTQSEETESLGEIGGRCSLSNTLQTQHTATHCGTLQQNAT